MNEAARCDHISLTHAGRMVVTDAPQALVAQRGGASLEATCVGYLRRIVRDIGALVDVLGGPDLLLFSAGIRQHNAEIRARVVAGRTRGHSHAACCRCPT